MSFIGIGIGVFARLTPIGGGSPPVIPFTYYQPGGTYTYFRPDGVSYFARP